MTFPSEGHQGKDLHNFLKSNSTFVSTYKISVHSSCWSSHTGLSIGVNVCVAVSSLGPSSCDWRHTIRSFPVKAEMTDEFDAFVRMLHGCLTVVVKILSVQTIRCSVQMPNDSLVMVMRQISSASSDDKMQRTDAESSSCSEDEFLSFSFLPCGYVAHPLTRIFTRGCECVRFRHMDKSPLANSSYHSTGLGLSS